MSFVAVQEFFLHVICLQDIFFKGYFLQIFNTLDCLDILILTVKAAQMYTLSSIYCFYIIYRSEKTLKEKCVPLYTNDFNMLYVRFGEIEE